MAVGSNGGESSEVVADSPPLPISINGSSSGPSSDHHSVAITAFKLNGHNFIPWSRSIQMLIRGKGKIGFIDGSLVQPSTSDPSFSSWDMNNSLVMSWLIHSMDSCIGELYLLYSTAKAIWDAVNLAYSDLEDSSQMFSLRTRIRNLRQETGTVTNYFHQLTRLWQELDLFQQQPWKDPLDGTLYRQMLAKERIYDFLAGLNSSLDEVRGRILGSKPLPSIDEIFAEVRREEHRKTIMLCSTPSGSSDASALVAMHPADRKKRAHTWCDFCNKPYHTREKCWKLHGKPSNGASNGPRAPADSSHAAAAAKSSLCSPSAAPFNQAQLDHLTKMMSSSTLTTSLMAHSGPATISDLHCEPWIVDSGASDHITGRIHLLSNFSPCSLPRTVEIANGSVLRVVGTGTIMFNPDFSLHNVLYVPQFEYNLMSISKLTASQHLTAIFKSNGCLFQDQITGRMIGHAKEHSGLYYFSGTSSSLIHSTAAVSTTTTLSRHQKIMLLHRRLGHPNFVYLRQLFPKLFRNNESFHCTVCQVSKHQRIPFVSQSYCPSHPFALVHSDVWGPSRISTLRNKRWFVTFTDDHTRVCWVFLLKEKSEVAGIFEQFFYMIKNQFNQSIKILRSDNGTEFFNTTLQNFISKHGIIHQSSCVNSPQQNGISERKNRHLLEVARSLLFTANLPKLFWGDAILTACFLINRQPSKILKFNTPLSVLRSHFPSSRVFSELELRVFGCKAFVHNLIPARCKFDPRSFECVFLGYSSSQKGYRCYYPPQKRYFVSHDVSFFEHQFYFTQKLLQGGISASEEFFGKLPTIADFELFWEPTPSSNPTNISNELAPTNISNNHDSPSPNSNPPISRNQSFSPNSSTPENLLAHQNQSNAQNSSPKSMSSNLENQIPVPTSNSVPVIPSGNIPGGKSAIQPYQFTYSMRDESRKIEEPEDPHDHEISPVSETELTDIDLPIAIRKGTRSCTQHSISNFLGYAHLSTPMQALVTQLSKESVPTTIQEAWQDPKWKKAVMEEMTALEKNGTWQIVTKSKDKKSVGCRWVFTIKYKSDGTIERYKARLVAKGYSQTHGVDYQETFAPVAKINSIRVLLSLAANHDWPLFQLDVKNAFLNGELEEEVYMDLPPGFNSNGDNKVCLLKKSLYGLKQSPRAWFGRFTKAILNFGYKQAHSDHTLFFKRQHTGLTILIVYVDDIVLTGDDKTEIQSVKNKLAAEFELKDLGNLRYFLGMEVARNRTGISVSQRKYTLDLLKETGFLGSRPVDTPMDPSLKLETKAGDPPVDKGRYQRLVGKLIYLSYTRPDIAFAVSCVSQFMHSPSEIHMQAIHRVLKYLKGTPGLGLLFKKNTHRGVELFTDADWAGSAEDRRSTSGYCTFVWGNLVTWRSKKQSVVARSSAEAELRSLALGICEGLWLKMFLEELGMKTDGPITNYCDNRAAISISHNPVHHDRVKHVEVDRHFIKEKVDEGILKIQYVHTTEQTADILTKPLFRPLFEKFTNKLGMFNLYYPA